MMGNAEIIVSKIISDLRGRKGIGDEFDQIDADIQEEITQTWIDIVESHGQTASN